MGSLVGVEVEIEKLSHHVNTSVLWEMVGDNSLRDNGAEFRFRIPLCGKDVVTAIDELESAIKLSSNKPALTYRTSVHVHIDVNDLSTEQRLKFALLYVIFEKALFRLHGNRKNNYYCVPYYKSDHELSLIGNYVKRLRGSIGERDLEDSMYFCQKYAAMNLKTSVTIGSFEFRHMGGTYDSIKILKWINILLCLKNYAVKPDIKWDSLPGIMSAYSPMGFLDEVFGEFSQELRYPNISKDMYEGARLADFVCHSAMWGDND